ncbi:MAG: class I SAM-dependent methyltransferase [Actinomycetota bacterium]
MTTDFDRYSDSYRDAVQRSIGFIGQGLDYFTEVKVRHLVELARRRLGDPGAVTALDVGCGVGITDGLLAEHFHELHAVDVSPAVIEVAREANPSVQYRLYDGTTLPYEEDSFELVFAICVLHHVPPPSWFHFGEELARVVKSGGLVSIVEHNPINPLTRVVVARCEFDEDAVLLSRRRTKDLLKGSGLTPVDESFILFSPWRLPFASWLEKNLHAVPLGAQYLVAARK